MHVLLVEDDLSLALGIQTALARADIDVEHAARGTAALQLIRQQHFDVAILDLGLPDMDGLEVLSHIQKIIPDLPVLILTARASIADKVKGLEQGADDYLPKPFDSAELIARVRVLVRRKEAIITTEIKVGSLCLSKDDHSLQIGEEPPVSMPRREYTLLAALMENAGRIQTRDSLEEKLYEWDDEVASNALEVHIHNVRKKLPKNTIKTVRGVGYILVDA